MVQSSIPPAAEQADAVVQQNEPVETLPVDLTDLSLEQLMDIPVHGAAWLEPEDALANDLAVAAGPEDSGPEALEDFPQDLTALNLVQLMNLRVAASPQIEEPEREEDPETQEEEWTRPEPDAADRPTRSGGSSSDAAAAATPEQRLLIDLISGEAADEEGAPTGGVGAGIVPAIVSIAPSLANDEVAGSAKVSALTGGSPANRAPVAGDDGAATDQDAPVVVTVLGNDGDADGDTLTVTGVTQGAGGTVVVNPDGTLTYTPSGGFTGADAFTYTLSDGRGGTDTGTVAVTVNALPANLVSGPGFHVGTNGIDQITGTSLSEGAGGEEIILGLAGDDTLTGDGNEDRLLGGAGADTLSGGAGNDSLIGGAGDDSADGGTGGDAYLFIEGTGSDTVSGGTGSDAIILVDVNGGAANLADWTLTLTTGTATWFADRVDLSAGATGTVTFTDGSGLTFDGIETITWATTYDVDGGNSVVRLAPAGGGTVTGNTREDTILGSAGDDTLTGDSNEDLLIGGAGDDALDGGSHDDMLLGEAGADTLAGGAGDDVLIGGLGADVLEGGDGDDLLLWDAADSDIDGGAGTDTLRVNGGDADLTAFAGEIEDIERIDLETHPGASTLTLTAQDLLDASDSDILTVLGGTNDTVNAGTGWTDGGVSGGFHTYTKTLGGDLATLLIDTDITVNPDIAA